MDRRAALLSLLSLSAGCAGLRIRRAEREVEISEDLPYLPGSAEPKHRLDLYLPRAGAPTATLVFVHGGFWRNQDRRYLQSLTGLYGNVGVALARRGLAVALPSYRLLPRARIEDQLADVAAATRAALQEVARRRGAGAAERLILGGYSAGAHLVSVLALKPQRLAAAGVAPGALRGLLSLSGLLDLRAMAAGQDEAFNRDVTDRLFGRAPAQLDRYSPLALLRAGAPPALILCAERDYPYVLSGGRAAAERLRALGARARHRVVPGLTHAGMILQLNRGDDAVSDEIAAFAREVAAAPPGRAT